MSEKQILSGNARRSPCGETKPSTLFFNDLFARTVCTLFKTFPECISVKHLDPSSVLDATLPDSWNDDSMTEKHKHLPSSLTHRATSAGYEFLSTDNTIVAEHSWIKENVKNLLHRNYIREMKSTRKKNAATKLVSSFDSFILFDK